MKKPLATAQLTKCEHGPRRGQHTWTTGSWHDQRPIAAKTPTRATEVGPTQGVGGEPECDTTSPAEHNDQARYDSSTPGAATHRMSPTATLHGWSPRIRPCQRGR